MRGGRCYFNVMFGMHVLDKVILSDVWVVSSIAVFKKARHVGEVVFSVLLRVMGNYCVRWRLGGEICSDCLVCQGDWGLGCWGLGISSVYLMVGEV